MGREICRAGLPVVSGRGIVLGPVHPHSQEGSMRCRASVLVTALLLAGAAQAQQVPARRPTNTVSTARPDSGPARRKVAMDPARAESLYVSTKEEDQPVANFQRDIDGRKRGDSIMAARSKGVLDFQVISYKSNVDG